MSPDSNEGEGGLKSSLVSRALDVGTLVLLGVATWTLLQSRGQGSQATRAGSAATAPIEVESAAGSTRALFTEMRAPRLVFIFRSDCPVCARQKPEWARLAILAERQGVRTLALTAETLRPSVKEFFATTPVEIFQAKHPDRLSTRFRTTVVPTTLLVGENGRVVFRAVGMMGDSAVRAVRRRIERLQGEHGG